MAPRFKIDAHVFYYSIALIGCSGTAYIAATVFGKTEEEKIKELVTPFPPGKSIHSRIWHFFNALTETYLQEYKFADRLQDRAQKRKDLQIFFDKMKNKDNNELDSKFDDVMKGGKGDVKRHGPKVNINIQSEEKKWVKEAKLIAPTKIYLVS